MNPDHIRRKGFVRTRDNIPVKYADPDKGLTFDQVELRHACGWGNSAPQTVGRTQAEIVKAHVFTFFNLIFALLALILLLTGSELWNMAFLLVAVCNTIIGIVQELRAKQAVDRLTLVTDQRFNTVRDGELVALSAHMLVRDDIVEFSAGDHICADAMVRTGELQVNESLITGEAGAVLKTPGDTLRSGTYVLAGSARAQLTQVGADALAAQLTAQVRQNPTPRGSEMRKALEGLLRIIACLLVPVGIALFCQTFFSRGLELRLCAETTVAALIGMIPEGLFLLTSIVLAAASLSLSRRRVLVQDMGCIETTVRADVLCVDKTGTITQPDMQVEQILPLSDDPPERLEAVLTALYGSEAPENDIGLAISELFNTPNDWKCLRRIPFTAAARWSGAVFEEQGTFLVGAPEAIMDSRYEDMKPLVEEWTGRGCRVVLVAQYHGEAEQGGLEDYKVVPLALIVLTSRIRPEAVAAFQALAEDGVVIKVLSGDNAATAADAARRCGIANAHRSIDASGLKTEAEYAAAVEEFTVFGRVSPEQKRELIHALQLQGRTVVMLGDGVNDVPAMKAADCAVALASGAAAANQAADFVLLGDDISAIRHLIRAGRQVVSSIRKAAVLFLVKNIFSLGLAMLCLIAGWSYPMLPVHMTVVSLLVIAIPALLLSGQPNDRLDSRQFLPTVLWQALPGGVTGILTILLAQLFSSVFSLAPQDMTTVCAALFGAVGLMVLWDVWAGETAHGRGVFWTMTAALTVCFTLLADILGLTITDGATALVFFALLLTVPTVYYGTKAVISAINALCSRFHLQVP